MVTIGSLWMPILVSAVIIWFASFLVWVVLPHHKSEYKGVPDEDATIKSLGDIRPGLYNIPHLTAMEEIKKPEVIKKFEGGPTGFLTVVPRGVPNMGKSMVLSFVYYLAVGVVVRLRRWSDSGVGDPLSQGVPDCRHRGMVGSRVGSHHRWYLVWTTVGAIAKHLLDTLAYGLLTGEVFGWLWPE